MYMVKNIYFINLSKSLNLFSEKLCSINMNNKDISESLWDNFGMSPRSQGMKIVNFNKTYFQNCVVCLVKEILKDVDHFSQKFTTLGELCFHSFYEGMKRDLNYFEK